MNDRSLHVHPYTCWDYTAVKAKDERCGCMQPILTDKVSEKLERLCQRLKIGRDA